jgi:hypothetical protein
MRITTAEMLFLRGTELHDELIGLICLFDPMDVELGKVND